MNDTIKTAPRALTLADTLAVDTSEALTAACLQALEANGYVVVEKYEIECLMGFAQSIRDNAPNVHHNASVIYGRLRNMLNRLQTFEREDTMKRAMRRYPSERPRDPILIRGDDI